MKGKVPRQEKARIMGNKVTAKLNRNMRMRKTSSGKREPELGPKEFVFYLVLRICTDCIVKAK